MIEIERNYSNSKNYSWSCNEFTQFLSSGYIDSFLSESNYSYITGIILGYLLIEHTFSFLLQDWLRVELSSQSRPSCVPYSCLPSSLQNDSLSTGPFALRELHDLLDCLSTPLHHTSKPLISPAFCTSASKINNLSITIFFFFFFNNNASCLSIAPEHLDLVQLAAWPFRRSTTPTYVSSWAYPCFRDSQSLGIHSQHILLRRA